MSRPLASGKAIPASLSASDRDTGEVHYKQTSIPRGFALGPRKPRRVGNLGCS